MIKVVLDTNVLVTALRSQKGASFKLLELLDDQQYTPVISPPLCLEYEDVLMRPGLLQGYSTQDIGDFLDYFLTKCMEYRVHFLWRPYLHDPKDDLVLEVTLAGEADFIITHNLRDFADVDTLGIRAVTPSRFLCILADKS